MAALGSRVSREAVLVNFRVLIRTLEFLRKPREQQESKTSKPVEGEKMKGLTINSKGAREDEDRANTQQLKQQQMSAGEFQPKSSGNDISRK